MTSEDHSASQGSGTTGSALENCGLNAEQLDSALDRHNWGKPSAAKRGRNPRWPYVPIVDFGEVAIGVHRTRTEQIRKKAFATRAEAVDYAARVIEARKLGLRGRLQEPQMRALRSQHGLPTELNCGQGA